MVAGGVGGTPKAQMKKTGTRPAGVKPGRGPLIREEPGWEAWPESAGPVSLGAEPEDSSAHNGQC